LAVVTSIARRRPLPRVSAPLDLWLLAGAALWLLGVGYGLRDPWPADEPRFALIGRDIIETGRWFIPHRGPEVYAEKPPVFLWLQALAYALTGSSRMGFLLPSLLAALGTLGLTWDLARRLYGRQIAFWAGMALLLTVQFSLQGRTAQIDMVLVLFTTLGLYGLLRHLLLGPAWGWYVLAGLATGIGVITKGTGFLPWLILIPYAIARWRGMYGLADIRGGWRWSLGPLALLLPILAWALPLLYFAAQPGNAEIAAYRDDLLLRQTVTRYANAWMHIKPFWYFAVEVVPVLWLPMSLISLWALPAWWRRIGRGDARPFLLLGWIALVLLFFSLSPGKRGVYILPALPALALALAPLLPGLLRRPGLQRGLAVLSVLISAVLVIAAGWALLGQPSFAARIELENGVAPWGWIFGAGVCGLAAGLIFWRRGMLAFAVLMLSLWTGYGLLGFAGMNAARSGAGLMQRAQAQLPAHARLGLLGGPEQFLLQAQGDARAFGFLTALAVQRQRAYAWLRESPQHWLLLQHPHLDACIDAGQSIDLGWSNRRHWVLIPSAAQRTDCPQAPANTGAEVAPPQPSNEIPRAQQP
jgi:4-amino-4-deoxy-L-arabinose transferase-like glycosyltransferase